MTTPISDTNGNLGHDAVDVADMLAQKMREMPLTGLREELVVDNRVFARITDGIYRRPSSALRELIFNAYDADATKVSINTDCPRFTRMEVVDNGNGMTERSLSNLLKHIGGSSKRTNRGIELGTASASDPDLSPCGRRLIGKIGIGLFAVAHLTTHFQIVTKAKGEKDWLVADIWLKTFTEDLLKNPPQEGEKPKFVTGEVFLSRDPANSPDDQGTTIALFDIRAGTQDILRRRELWESILEKELSEENSRGEQRSRPEIHIGFTDESRVNYLVSPSLPWKVDDTPETKFRKFFDRVATGSQLSTKNPDIEEFLDEYFAMLWRLSLAAPLPYLNNHPFNTKLDEGIEVYKIENKIKGRATPLEGQQGATALEAFGLTIPEDPAGAFDIYIDGIRLLRPVDLPYCITQTKKSPVQKSPLLFVGKMKSTLGDVDPTRSGGALEFEAYFYWNSLIVPKQNRGALIRINNASGVLYDDSFLDYQVSELNRLNQITAEIFVKRGLDAALNIDRESFNVSHPHYQYLSKWVHGSLRQITNLLKDASKRQRVAAETKKRTGTLAAVEDQIGEIWERKGDPLDSPPEIVVQGKESNGSTDRLRLSGSLAYGISTEALNAAKTSKATIAEIGAIETAKAVFSVLAAYGVLEKMEYADQESMFEDVLKILTTEAKE